MENSLNKIMKVRTLKLENPLPSLINDFVEEEATKLAQQYARVLEAIDLNCQSLELLGSEALDMLSLTSEILDLAVLCYARAHIERFDQKFLRLDMDHLKISPIGSRELVSPMLKRQRLACLNKFLSKKDV